MANQITDALKEIGLGAVDLLFPPRCLACGALAEPFCGECRGQILPVRDSPLPARVADVRSAGFHEGPLRRAVLRLKFGRKTALAGPLGELLAAELAETQDVWRPDALVPVPIHWTRRLERGYNQSELIAQSLARQAGLPVVAAIRRTRPTPPQVGRSGPDRLTNLRGAFAADPRRPITGRRVVLIDDVRTTGATLSECAGALRAAGAAEVFGLTVTFEA